MNYLSTAYLGRYQLGDRLPLFLQCWSSSKVPTAPVDAPVFVIYNNAGTKVANGKLPARDLGTAVGLFGREFRLHDSSLTAGLYTILYTYKTGSVVHSRIQAFELMSGGDAKGDILSLDFFRRPDANYLMIETEDGQILQGRNPRETL